jgi:hypothetical protein
LKSGILKWILTKICARLWGCICETLRMQIVCVCVCVIVLFSVSFHYV